MSQPEIEVSEPDFRLQDFIEVLNPETQAKEYGKVTKIDKGVVHYHLYKPPEQLPGGRQPHHSRVELIRTDESSKEYLQNVIRKVEVLRF